MKMRMGEDGGMEDEAEKSGREKQKSSRFFVGLMSNGPIIGSRKLIRQ